MQTTMLPTKVCTRCGREDAIESFPPRKGTRDGRHFWCRECFREHHRIAGESWRHRNRERQRANARRQYRENAEWRREQATQYRERDREKINERARRYQRDAWADPLKRARILDRNHRRRVATRNTPDLANLIAELHERPCDYCGVTEDIVVDHVVPLSRGGLHAAENLAPACRSCNSKKRNKLLSEWKGP